MKNINTKRIKRFVNDELNEELGEELLKDVNFILSVVLSPEKLKWPLAEITFGQWQNIYTFSMLITHDNDWERKAVKGLLETARTEEERLEAGQISLLTAIKHL